MSVFLLSLLQYQLNGISSVVLTGLKRFNVKIYLFIQYVHKKKPGYSSKAGCIGHLRTRLATLW